MWWRPCGRLADLCAIAVLAAISVATVATGAAHTRIYGHDIFIFLDAGWRVLNGQRPEIDFNPSMGALMSLLAAAGLKLAHDSVEGIGYMNALVSGMVGGWAYLLGRRRMAAIAAALAAAVVALIAAAPFPIGLPPNMLSHVMVYNRYRYALLGLILLECFQPGASSAAGGISSGVVSIALLFIKPSYCLVALGFLAVSLLLQRMDWRRVAGIVLGLLAAGLAMMAYLRFDFAALWNDLHLMSQARSSGLSPWNFKWAFFDGASEFLPPALLAVLVATVSATIRPLLITAVVWMGGGLLLATNAQPAGYPLNAVLALLLIEYGRQEAGSAVSAGARFPGPATIVVLLGLIGYAPVALGNASGLAYALIESRRAPPEPFARFRSTPLANLIFYDVPDGTDADQRSNGRAYVDSVNDGMDLIRRASRPDETISTLDMVNPFSYALLRRPPQGGSPALAFNHTFSDEHKPSSDSLFGSADLVMVPKHAASAEPDARALFRNYLPAIERDFRLSAESDYWKLYRRANAPSWSTATAAR